MKKIILAAGILWAFSAQAQEQPNMSAPAPEQQQAEQKELPAVAAALTLEEAVASGAVDADLLRDSEITAVQETSVPADNETTVVEEAVPADAEVGAEAVEIALTPVAAPAAATDNSIDSLQEQFKAQLEKFINVFQDAIAKMQSDDDSVQQETAQKPAAVNNAAETAETAAVTDPVPEKIFQRFTDKVSREMALIALCAERNKKLPEPTGGDMQSVIMSVKMHPLQENMSSVADGHLDALTVIGDAQDDAGNITKLSIDRNLALYVTAYDILNNTVTPVEGEKVSLLTLLNKTVTPGKFVAETVKGYKTFIADAGDSAFAVMIISPYLMIRAETAGVGYADRIRGVFDGLDLTQIVRAMKLPPTVPTTEELIAEMTAELDTPQGKEAVKNFFGTDVIAP